jgi:hypothetical protein
VHESGKAILHSASDSEQLESLTAMLRSWSSQQKAQLVEQPMTGVVKGANITVSAAQNKLTNIRATMTASHQQKKTTDYFKCAARR